jgi:hypothetical protein
MASFDTRLVGPPPARLVACLVEAFGRANEGLHLLRAEPDHWEEFVARLGGQAEGRRQWSDAQRGETARVSLAWWTDHVGRRHFRVVGGNSRDGSYRTLDATRTDPRPPLWHLYPDRLFYRERDGGGGWLAACGCGACGPPAALGWMGASCGPCHDRRQEGGPLPQTIPTYAFAHQGTARTLAFSPDGRTLAVLGEGDARQVRLHDLASGEWRALAETASQPRRLAFSPDGRLLAETYHQNVVLSELDGGEAVLDVSDPGQFLMDCLAFSADGRQFAAGGATGVRVWRRLAAGGGWEPWFATRRPATALAFAPDGASLAVGCSHTRLTEEGDGAPVVVLDLLAGAERPAEGADELRHHTTGDLAFTADGLLVAITALSGSRALRTLGGVQLNMPAGSVVFRTVDPGISHFGVSAGRCRLLHRLPLNAWRAQAFLAPGGQWAAVVSPDSTLVTVLEAVTGRAVGAVGWDLLRQAAGVVFSPDGQTMAVLDDGQTVKLVPWRMLLGA